MFATKEEMEALEAALAYIEFNQQKLDKNGLIINPLRHLRDKLDVLDIDKKLDEEINLQIKQLPGTHSYTDGNNWIKTKEENLIYLILHFIEWQKAKDESRKQANIKMANTDAEVDPLLEMAFNDIWSDVEKNVEAFKNLSPENKEKLKKAHHDTFESGAIWKERQLSKE